MNNTYSTRNEALESIATAIEAGEANAQDYNLEAIADAVLDTTEGYEFYVAVSEGEFWQAVADNEIAS